MERRWHDAADCSKYGQQRPETLGRQQSTTVYGEHNTHSSDDGRDEQKNPEKAKLTTSSNYYNTELSSDITRLDFAGGKPGAEAACLLARN